MIKRILILTSLLTVSLFSDANLLSARSQQQSSWQPFLQRIVSRTPIPRKRGGGRGDWEVISPGIWAKQLWTLQPSLIWRTSKQIPNRVDILQAGSGTPLWSQTIRSGSTIPIAVKLEPSRTYFVRFIKRNADLQKDEIVTAWEFQTLSIAQRQKITAELDRIDKKLKPLEQLQRRIEVFAKSELWSDAFQEIERSSLSPIERQAAIDQLLAQLKSLEPSQRRS